MKKYILLVGLAFALTVCADSTYGQGQSVPPPPTDHGVTGDQVAGGSAPIGGGLFILLGLGAAYAGKKLYDHRKILLEE